MTSKYYSRNFAKRFLVPTLDFYLDYFRKEKRTNTLIKLLESGDIKTIANCIENLFKKKRVAINIPNIIGTPGNLFSIAISANLHVFSPSILNIDINLPPKSVVPTTTKQKVKSGKELELRKAEIIIDQQYKDSILIAFASIIHNIISVVPTLNTIYASGYVSKINQKGYEYQACIITAVIDINTYDELIIGNLTAETILLNFPHRFKLDKNLEFEEVNPYKYNEISREMQESLIDLDLIDPLEFEKLIANLLRKIGIESRTTSVTNDGGIDIIGIDERSISGGKYIIQCKRHKETISVRDIRDLYGVVTHERANKGIFITTSDYSSECLKFADGKPLELINRKKLTELLNQHNFGVKISDNISINL